MTKTKYSRGLVITYETAQLPSCCSASSQALGLAGSPDGNIVASYPLTGRFHLGWTGRDTHTYLSTHIVYLTHTLSPNPHTYILIHHTYCTPLRTRSLPLTTTERDLLLLLL